MSRLVSKVGVAVVLRGLGAAAAFGMNVVFGQLLGVEGAGLYYLALSVTSIGSVIARLGLDQILLRFIAAEIGAGEPARGWTVFRTGMLAATAVSLLLTTVVFVFARPITAGLFDAPDMVAPLRYLSPAIVTFSLMSLVAESLKGLNRIVPAMLVSGVIYPVVGIALAWPLVSILGPAGATLSYVLATAAAAGWGLWVFARAYPDRAGPADFAPATIARCAYPLWTASIINRAALPWLPLMLLGVWGTTSESGAFGAATRIVQLVTLFLVAVNTVIAPQIAQLHRNGETARLGYLVRRFTRYLTLISAPAILVLLIWPGEVLSMFGPGFDHGATALRILALGQAINVATGSVGVTLAMTGHERDVRTTAALSVAVLLATAALTMPRWPMIGAATAAAAALATSNLFAAWAVRRKLGFWAVPLPSVRRGGGG